jgi:hypothetical protein
VRKLLTGSLVLALALASAAEAGEKNIIIDQLSVAGGEMSPTIPQGDLGVQTHKWEGKIVQTRLACFFADDSDMRCLDGNVGRIDFTTIGPEPAKKFLQANCNSLASLNSPACRVTVRFLYVRFKEADLGGAIGTITVVQALQDTGFIVGRK